MTGFEHCQYFVTKKKRFCRLTVKKGRKYCGEHQINDKSVVLEERVTCPLDPTHSCYKSKLFKHLKECNANIKLMTLPPYVVKGINLGDTDAVINEIPLSKIDQSTIDAVLNKIKNSYDKLPEIPIEVFTHEVLEKELNNPTYGTEAKRHLLQIASLLGHLKNADLIRENTCFIEFGAGRGKLTYWLGQSIKDQNNSSILLVDHSSHRHKKDNKLKNEESDLEIRRLRVDIADLKLSDVPEVSNVQCKVAIAKHICGAATDLTIRCLTNSIKDNESSKAALVIAFCCHHRCEYSHYVGYKYLEDEGFTKDEFPILCKIASWATCGIKQTKDEDAEREAIGRKVKALLNWGRLEYLKGVGFKCRLVYYATVDTTLENMCIIASYTKESELEKQI